MFLFPFINVPGQDYISHHALRYNTEVVILTTSTAENTVVISTKHKLEGVVDFIPTGRL